MLQQLNRDFGIAGALEFISGAGELPMIKIETSLATAVVSLHGAQVLSFQPKSAECDLLFLSEKANYQQGKAIRGGIPICWPWFSREKPKPPHQPNHGFARITTWQLAETSRIDDVIQLRLILQDSVKTREMWDHAFELTLDITISEELSLSLTAENTDLEPFLFSQAMHTYFSVSEVEQISVSGLEGIRYIDTVGAAGEDLSYLDAENQQTGNIQVSAEMDRIYTDFSDNVRLQDGAFNRMIDIESSGSQTTVIWNPWQVTSTKMQDLNDNDYQRFICIETVNTGMDVVVLAPTEKHTMSVTYAIVE